MGIIMKHSLISSLLTLATVSLQATVAVVDYVSGTPISSSGYYQYHTKWVTTTCYETITKSNDCSYDGGDFVGDYETVSPQVHPGPDYKDYNTVYETVYETAYPYPYPYEAASSYPYETAQPYPSDIVCYPETVYSTVYPESSDYHTFTTSGTDETVTGSPVYHTMDSTILETVTATPSGESGSEGSECSTGPWIVNPGFEDSWPGAWFPTDQVSQVLTDTSDGSTGAARFTSGRGEARLEQAIIIPNNNQYVLRFWFRGDGNPADVFAINIFFGSYMVQGFNLFGDTWQEINIDFGMLNGPFDCVPVVLSIEFIENESEGPQAFVVDRFELLIVT